MSQPGDGSSLMKDKNTILSYHNHCPKGKAIDGRRSAKPSTRAHHRAAFNSDTAASAQACHLLGDAAMAALICVASPRRVAAASSLPLISAIT